MGRMSRKIGVLVLCVAMHLTVNAYAEENTAGNDAIYNSGKDVPLLYRWGRANFNRW